MKVYCQFQKLSTGYIPNTTPPQFSDEYKKPIDALGSDGVFILDGRNSLSTQIEDSLTRLEKINRNNSIVSFKIVKADSFLDEGRVVYQHKDLI